MTRQERLEALRVSKPSMGGSAHDDRGHPMTPLTPAAVMDEQRLQEIMGYSYETDWVRDCIEALIAEVRRLQQQQKSVQETWIDEVTQARQERDAALAERDRARNELAACLEASRLGYSDASGPMKRALDAESENGELKESLAEARRVLREVQWDRSGECPLCGGLRDGDTHVYHASHVEVVRGHFPACALAAVLAQEEPS